MLLKNIIAKFLLLRQLRRFISYLLKLFLLQAIKFYQYFISPFLGPSCRFTPSCSTYAQESLTKFGVLKGTKLTIKRVVKCRPFGKFGYDPVPDLKIKK
ncbi:Membrane protein insertion efficiency factor YidD [Candidatus Hepatincolaceae symbiont of Richtersius coronifer]